MITPQKKHSLRNVNDKYLTPYSLKMLDNSEFCNKKTKVLNKS